jgi:hypothetical protein
MIAADTGTWVVFLEGGRGEDAQLLDRALEDRQRSQKLQASILYLGPERSDATSSRGRGQHVGIVGSFHVFYKTFRSWVQDWVQSEKGNVFTASP